MRDAAALGWVYLLGGRIDDAVTMLEKATADCSVLRAPIIHARALVWPGDAYAARSDHLRTCQAYRRLASRWKRSARETPLTLTRALAAMEGPTCRP